VQAIESPTLNLVFADTSGNIGYYVTGRAPIRRSGMGQVPMPGWSGDFDWLGDIPFEEMPHALNPTAGFLVNANNKLVAADYPYFLGNAWSNGYRARRIAEFIEERDSLTLEDMRQLQGDLHSIPGRELCDYLGQQFAALEPGDADARECLAILRQWDGQMAPNSTGALAYKMLVFELSLAILTPRLGKSLAERYLAAGSYLLVRAAGESFGQWIVVLLRLMRADDSFWVSNKIQLLEKCLARAMCRLRSQLGDEPSSWTWATHKIEFGHTLSPQRPFNDVFGVGPFGVGGDADAVCQMSVDPDDYTNSIAPSFRLLIDAGAWDVSQAMHAPGQSGHLASPHYADLAQLWLRGEYYRLPWRSAAAPSPDEVLLQLLPWSDSRSAWA
jgi:penicillin amidase